MLDLAIPSDLAGSWAHVCRKGESARFAWAGSGKKANGWVEFQGDGVLATKWGDGTWRTVDHYRTELTFGNSRHLCRIGENGDFTVETKTVVKTSKSAPCQAIGWLEKEQPRQRRKSTTRPPEAQPLDQTVSAERSVSAPPLPIPSRNEVSPQEKPTRIPLSKIGLSPLHKRPLSHQTSDEGSMKRTPVQQEINEARRVPTKPAQEPAEPGFEPSDFESPPSDYESDKMSNVPFQLRRKSRGRSPQRGRSRSPYHPRSEPRAGEHITHVEKKENNKNLTTPKNPFAMNRSEVMAEQKNVRLEEKACRIGKHVAQIVAGATPAGRGQRYYPASTSKQLFHTPVTSRHYESESCTTGPADSPMPDSLMSSHMEQSICSARDHSDSNQSWADSRQRSASIPAFEDSKLANRVWTKKELNTWKARSHSAEPTMSRTAENNADASFPPAHLLAAANARIQQKCKDLAANSSLSPMSKTPSSFITWTAKDLEANGAMLLSFKQDNPKRRGAKPWEMYEKYKVAKTVGEFLALHGKKEAVKTWRADAAAGALVVIQTQAEAKPAQQSHTKVDAQPIPEAIQAPKQARAPSPRAPSPVATPVATTKQAPAPAPAPVPAPVAAAKLQKKQAPAAAPEPAPVQTLTTAPKRAAAKPKTTTAPKQAPAAAPEPEPVKTLLPPRSARGQGDLKDIKSAVLQAASSVQKKEDFFQQTPQRQQVRNPLEDLKSHQGTASPGEVGNTKAAVRVPVQDAKQQQESIAQGDGQTRGRPRRKSLIKPKTAANETNSLFHSPERPATIPDANEVAKTHPEQVRRKSPLPQRRTASVPRDDPAPRPAAVPERALEGSEPKPVAVSVIPDVQDQPRPQQRRKSPAREAKPVRGPIASEKVVSKPEVAAVAQEEPVPKPVAAPVTNEMQDKPRSQQRRKSPAREAKPVRDPIAPKEQQALTQMQAEQQKVQDDLRQQLAQLQQQQKEQQERLELERQQKDKLREQLEELQRKESEKKDEPQPPAQRPRRKSLPPKEKTDDPVEPPAKQARRKSLPPKEKTVEPPAKDDPVEPPAKQARRKSLPNKPPTESQHAEEITGTQGKYQPLEKLFKGSAPAPITTVSQPVQAPEEKPKPRRKSTGKQPAQSSLFDPSMPKGVVVPQAPQDEGALRTTPPNSPRADPEPAAKQTRLRRKSTGMKKDESKHTIEGRASVAPSATPARGLMNLSAEMAARRAVEELQASATRRKAPTRVEEPGHKRQRRSPPKQGLGRAAFANVESPLLFKSSVHYGL